MSEARSGIWPSSDSLQLINRGILDKLKRKQVFVMPHERIEMKANVRDGKPVIRGTRIPVELVPRKLGSGMSPDAILLDHPRLRLEDLVAQAFAADYVASEEIIYR